MTVLYPPTQIHGHIHWHEQGYILCKLYLFIKSDTSWGDGPGHKTPEIYLSFTLPLGQFIDRVVNMSRGNYSKQIPEKMTSR